MTIYKMIIQVDETFSIEVSFDRADREEGYLDDIRFRLIESGPKETKILKADSTSFLLTVEQAEKLAVCLKQAATASKKVPRSNVPKTFRVPF
jgi:hypothetical protein